MPTEKAQTLVEIARADINDQLERLINGMGQKEFETFVKFAEAANCILENKGE